VRRAVRLNARKDADASFMLGFHIEKPLLQIVREFVHIDQLVMRIA